MKCWICGNDANSGEHLMKASDLQSLFGHVTQQAPLYFHTDQRETSPSQGLDPTSLSTRLFSVLTATTSARNRMTEHGNFSPLI
jgi:hypothetical protein